MLRTITLLTVLVFASFPLFAQNAIDSASRQGYANAVASYEQFTGKQSRLYNGIQHIGYTPQLRGHGYFLDKNLVSGNIWYDGMLYRNVPMRYDLIADEVVIQHFDTMYLISLTSEKIRSFDLAGHHFVRILKDSTIHKNLSTGFYDLLYDGPTTLLAKRSKAIIESIVDNKLQYNIREQERLYIRKDNIYQRVNSYNELLGMLQDHKKDVRRYLKKQKIKFRKDHETAVMKAVQYYDSLKN